MMHSNHIVLYQTPTSVDNFVQNLQEHEKQNMASAGRQFSIVVFGASGFTGQFVVREVARNCRGKFKWAVAGRSKDKLEKVLQETADELGGCTS